MYYGDITEDATITLKFTSRDTDGLPATLSGSPAVSVYKKGTVSPSTAGVTLSVDYNSKTGLNYLVIDTSSDAFYATAFDYDAVLTAGTVDGTSVIGEVVGSFSIENRNGTGLDASGVRSAIGMASADLDTQLDALATSAALATVDSNVDAILVDTDSTIPGLITGLNDLSAADVNTQVDTALSDYDGPTKTEMDAAFTEIKGATWTTTDTLEAIRDRGDSAWTTGSGGDATEAKQDTIISALTTVDNNVDAILVDTNELQTDWVDGGRLDLIIDSILADTNEIQTDLVDSGRLDLIFDAILVDTGTTIPDQITALNNLSAEDVNAEVDTALSDYDGPTNTEMVAAFTEIKGATWATTDTLEAIRDRGDSAWTTATGFSTHSAADVINYDMGDSRTVKQALHFLRNKWVISGGTLTVYQTDDSTESWTASMTQTAGNPTSAMDPA